MGELYEQAGDEQPMACSGLISAGEHPDWMQERLQSVKQSSSVLGQPAALSYEADLRNWRGCEVGVGSVTRPKYSLQTTNVRLGRGCCQS
jgi:hypothetical protein